MPSGSFIHTFLKYLPTPQSRKKFKRQSLKQKNILEQTESIQIGCKIQKLYDFYSSKNYLQVNIFIGNKTPKPIQNYAIQFKGTNNLQVYLEQKEQRVVKENTQAKERIVLQWLPQQKQHYSSEIFLVLSFTSSILTLKNTPIPLSLWSFYNFPQEMHRIIDPSLEKGQLMQMMGQRYQLMEEKIIEINTGIFKKGMGTKEIERIFDKLIKVSSNGNSLSQQERDILLLVGFFTIKSLLQEVLLMIQINFNKGEQPFMKVILAGNQYKYFESVFENLEFLLGK